jgi:hypothetical protein
MLLVSDDGNMEMPEKIVISLFIFVVNIIFKNMMPMMVLTYNKFDGRNHTSSMRRFKRIIKIMKTISIVFFVISLLIGILFVLSLILDLNQTTQDVIIIWMTLPIWLSFREGIIKAMDMVEE